jgi:hypothetical protein
MAGSPDYALSAYPELGVKFNRPDAIAGVEIRA